MAGIFGNMFDLNRDGKIGAFERAMELQFLDSMTKDSARNNAWDDEDDWDDDELTELELAGIDPEELEYMDDEFFNKKFSEKKNKIGEINKLEKKRIEMIEKRFIE